jgi:hypothetical protein
MLVKLVSGDQIPLTLGAKVVAKLPTPIPEPAGVRWMAKLGAPEVQDSDLKHPSAPKAEPRADLLNEIWQKHLKQVIRDLALHPITIDYGDSRNTISDCRIDVWRKFYARG